MPDVLDPAATAWVLASTAMVLLMTPALALFYGGMVRTTGVLNMMMMSLICIPLVTLVWILFGYSLVFTEGFAGIIGGAELIGLDLDVNEVHGTVPTLLFVTFQLTFAIITAALVSGAIADRARFAAWVAFVPVWLLIVYVPIAHWVWGPGGWIAEWGVLDYAGGLVVEITSGASALALALVLGTAAWFQGRVDAAAQSAVRADRRRPAVVRLVRFQLRFGAGRRRQGRRGPVEHAGRRRHGDARLARRRADPRRTSHLVRRRIGSRGRTGRDHPGLWGGLDLGSRGGRPRGRRHLLLGDRPEAPLQL